MKTQIDLGLLILRVGAGVLLMTHGVPKLMQVIEGNFEFGDPIGIGPAASLVLAAFAEATCALLVVLGVKTRWSAVPPFLTMAVAGFIFHAADPLQIKELAFLYGIVFLALVFTGGGSYSFDGWWAKRRRPAGSLRR